MILKKKDLPPRVAQCTLLLEKYDYEIEHRPEIRMKHADTLSRHPVCLVLTETKAQNEDEHIHLLKKILEEESYQNYILINDILYKVKNAKLIVLPKKMQTEIIRKN